MYVHTINVLILLQCLRVKIGNPTIGRRTSQDSKVLQVSLCKIIYYYISLRLLENTHRGNIRDK